MQRGHKFSEEHRRKLSESHKGLVLSISKNCRKCKLNFNAKSTNHQYCNKCRTIICLQCKKEFLVVRKLNKRKFCSPHCSGIYTFSIFTDYQWDKFKERISKIHRGRIRSLETKIKKSIAMLGIKNHRYINGSTKHRVEAVEGIAYRSWRRGVFERDNYTCRECGIRGGELQADHIKRWALFPNLRFELSNGQTLCKRCHLDKTKEENKLYWLNQFNPK